MLQAFRRLGSACAAFLGHHGSVTQHACARGLSRQALYREADAALADLDEAAARQRQQASARQVEALRQRVAELEARLAQAVVLGPEQLAELAACAQATGTSLSACRALLRVLLADRAPSVASLGRLAQAAGRKA